MSTAVIPATCTCGSLSPDVLLCPDHHRYFRKGRELASVSRVLKSTWPIPPDFSKADPDVLENARERGIVADALFSAYVNGTLKAIPAGTRIDSVELFMKARTWWDQRPKTEAPARTQVILADDEIAGTCDLLTANGIIVDMKCTYAIEPIYALQLGGYADLHDRQFGTLPMLGILHVTKRYDEARLIPLKALECLHDWRTLRAMWSLVQRRTA